MAKLTFMRLKPNGEPDGSGFTVDYNPTELAFTKGAQYAELGVPGLDAPITQFVRGDAETLSLELFFDTTDGGTGANAPLVSARVIQLQRLVSIDGNLHTPPVVRLSWGDGFPGAKIGAELAPYKSMDVIVTGLTRKYTLFSAEGRPLRATVTLQMKQYLRLRDQQQQLNPRSPDHTRSHIVREGETLPLIAWDAYGDAAKWRVIADTNGLADARDLAPGRALQLPPLA